MWYYNFFNQNPSWKIFPLRYELLTEKKLKPLDYIVICNNSQKVFNLDKSKNYIRTSKINFKLFKDFELVYKKGVNYSIQNDYPSENPECFYIFINKKLKKIHE